MKIVIGLVGEKGSGKGTFVSLLREIVPKKSVAQIRFSDILFETLDLWGIQTTRRNLQELAIAMRNTYGEDIIARVTCERAVHVRADIVILDGIRWPPEVGMIRKLLNNTIVYVTADSRLRYERLKVRGEKVGEANATLEQFLEEELAATESFISSIGAAADFRIVNDTSVEDFRRQVEEFVRTKIKAIF